MGQPSRKDTFMGALVSKEHMDRVKGYIRRALAGGAQSLCGEGKHKLVHESPEGLPKVETFSH